jgi:shikimate kinase
VKALALIGFMGCGKSTVGRLVAERAEAPYKDLDTIIEGRCGMTIAELFRTRGEPAFRVLEAELLPEVLEPGVVASLGGGAPLDERNWSAIRERAVTVWLDAPLQELLVRADRDTRPLLQGRSGDQLQALFDSRSGRYQQADHHVDATREPEMVAEEVLHLWRG